MPGPGSINGSNNSLVTDVSNRANTQEGDTGGAQENQPSTAARRRGRMRLRMPGMFRRRTPREAEGTRDNPAQPRQVRRGPIAGFQNMMRNFGDSLQNRVNNLANRNNQPAISHHEPQFSVVDTASVVSGSVRGRVDTAVREEDFESVVTGSVVAEQANPALELAAVVPRYSMASDVFEEAMSVADSTDESLAGSVRPAVPEVGAQVNFIPESLSIAERRGTAQDELELEFVVSPSAEVTEAVSLPADEPLQEPATIEPEVTTEVDLDLPSVPVGRPIINPAPVNRPADAQPESVDEERIPVLN